MNRPAFMLALSIAALSSAVKAQEKNLPVVNLGKSDFSRLVALVMTSGDEAKFANGIAQAVGLPNEMPARGEVEIVSSEGKDIDQRDCSVVYEPDESDGKRPVCVYISRAKRFGRTSTTQYFKVSLDGQLEKAVTLSLKRDDDGNLLREGRSKSVEDIDSPEIKKAFKTELGFWVKDWLKKQGKVKTDTATAPPANANTPAAAAH